MLKRKPSCEVDGDPHVRSSIFGARRRRKRLFRSFEQHAKHSWQPDTEREMKGLLDYILQHEDAFKNQYRLSSLYADFGQQLEVNPEGYHANIAAWNKALTDAARVGLMPQPRGVRDTTTDCLIIRATDDLARALQHPQYGMPTCLPAVFHDAVQKKELISHSEFLSAKESIYKTSWLPTPWQAFRWGLRQLGVLGQPSSPQKLGGDLFVVLKNVEAAANEIVKKMKKHTSTADRSMSKADFSKRFTNVLNPTTPLSEADMNILLVHLARDKQQLLCDGQTVKFKAEHEAVPEPITQEDQAIGNLRDTLANIHAQIQPLNEKIAAADAAAREAVTAKQMVRAKAALRLKKLAETALTQRADLAFQLESVYNQLQSAADQVGIVEAMRAGADALKSLNEKVGGAEGVQGVVDAVRDQMAITDEITDIIYETAPSLDEGEIDDEFEALEKAEKEKIERAEAAKTATRLAELAAVEEKRRQKEAEEVAKQAQQQSEQDTQADVEKASAELSRLSFVQRVDGDDLKDAETEERIAMPS
ncbi:hypothetical protein ACEQ8H_005599 [Pleosporales sp. CAS-2024a]